MRKCFWCGTSQQGCRGYPEVVSGGQNGQWDSDCRFLRPNERSCVFVYDATWSEFVEMRSSRCNIQMTFERSNFGSHYVCGGGGRQPTCQQSQTGENSILNLGFSESRENGVRFCSFA
jgi:hypothetical protein